MVRFHEPNQTLLSCVLSWIMFILKLFYFYTHITEGLDEPAAASVPGPPADEALRGAAVDEEVGLVWDLGGHDSRAGGAGCGIHTHAHAPALPPLVLLFRIM